jgi:hypothetical protein
MPLAADGVVGRELLAQLRVGDLPLEVSACDPLDRAQQAPVLGEPHDDELTGPVHRRAVEPLHRRDPPEQPPLRAGEGTVGARGDPRRGPLEDRDLGGLVGEVRDELDGRRPGADHPDAFAGEVVVVIPAGRVEEPAREGVEPRQVGDHRLGQRSGGRDEEPRRVGGLGVGGDDPAGGALVEARLDHGGPEADAVDDAVVAGDAAEVVEDLVLGREAAAPPGVGRERERVEVGGHVAGRPRVGVVPPGPADVVAAFEQHDVVDARVDHPDGAAEPGEAGADHEHLVVLGAAGRGHGGRGHRALPEIEAGASAVSPACSSAGSRS